MVIKPENPYFASRPGLEVTPLGISPLEPRSSQCRAIIPKTLFILKGTDFMLARSLFFKKSFAATQLARQLQQERTQVVYSNKEARKRLARRTPAMDRGHMNVVLKSFICMLEVDLGIAILIIVFFNVFFFKI